MDLHQLRSVLAVARTRNFTRAARERFIVQSALSHQIKSLERELGVELFARTSRRVELTPAGAAFLPGAAASVEAADRAAVDAAAAGGIIGGQLTLGLIPTVTGVDVAAALSVLRTAHPGVRVVIRGGGSDTLACQVRDGEVDVAVLGLAEHSEPQGVRGRVLSTQRLVAVLSSQHRLAARQTLVLSDLAEETFVDFPAGSPGRAQSDRAFERAGLNRDVAFEVMLTDMMVDLISHDLACALLPESSVPLRDAVVCVPVDDGPIRHEFLVWSEFNPTPAASAFLGILEPFLEREAPAE
ncbi:MAG: LysR family transcriptional regulator [Mycetocola sp.]